MKKNPYKKSNPKKYIMWEVLNCHGNYNGCINNLGRDDFRPPEDILLEKLLRGERKKMVSKMDDDPYRERTQMISVPVSIFPEYIAMYWKIKDKKSFWFHYKTASKRSNSLSNRITPKEFYQELNKKQETK